MLHHRPSQPNADFQSKCIYTAGRSFHTYLSSHSSDFSRFLQFGSPHGLSSQAQFIAAQRKEIWVNIGYRVSAFGFLACDVPRLSGNYGFKDQWLALGWIKENIAAFGGRYLTSGVGAGLNHQDLHRKSGGYAVDGAFCRYVFKLTMRPF